MFKKITAVLLSAVMMVAVFGLMPTRVVAASSSDYGMFVGRFRFNYSTENNKTDLEFIFHLGADKTHDVTYTARVLDSNGGTVASWTGANNRQVVTTGTRRATRSFRIIDISSVNLVVGSRYTFRIIGSVIVNGREQSYHWNYTFTHRPEIENHSAADLGLSSKFSYVGLNNQSNPVFDMWYTANKGYDTIYKVRIINSSGALMWYSSNFNVDAWEGEVSQRVSVGWRNRTFSPGPYVVEVYGMVEFDGLHNVLMWTYHLDVN